MHLVRRVMNISTFSTVLSQLPPSSDTGPSFLQSKVTFSFVIILSFSIAVFTHLLCECLTRMDFVSYYIIRGRSAAK